MSASTAGTSHHRDDAENEEQTSKSPPKPGEVSVAVRITAYVAIAAVRCALVVVPASPTVAHVVDVVRIGGKPVAAEHGVFTY